eukprot:g22598.t1
MGKILNEYFAPVFTKEKDMDEIAEYLEVYSKIGQSQHGFIKGRLCLTNLLEFFEEVMSRVDQGEPMDVIYLNSKKAFDKVPRRRLL